MADDRLSVLVAATEYERLIIHRFMTTTLAAEIDSELLKDYDADEERVILEFLDAIKDVV